MTTNIPHGPFTIQELVDTIRGHWQIAGVDVGDVERAIEQADEHGFAESPPFLERTKQHIEWMIDACRNRTLVGNCSPRIHEALDEFRMAATSLADAWSSIGHIGLNGKRTVRQLGLAIDRVSSAFDEIQRLTDCKKTGKQLTKLTKLEKACLKLYADYDKTKYRKRADFVAFKNRGESQAPWTISDFERGQRLFNDGHRPETPKGP